MTGLSASEVQNCAFSKLCSKTWETLSPIKGERAVRFCGDCRQLVHLCKTAAQVKAHAKERHCVAIVVRNSPRRLVGDVSHYG